MATYNTSKSVPLEDPWDALLEGMAAALGRGASRRRRQERGRARKLSPGALEALRRDRESGMKLRELADRYGLSVAQVSRLTRQLS